MHLRFVGFVIVGSLLAGVIVQTHRLRAAEDVGAEAAAIIEATGLRRGICTIVGDDDPRHSAQLAVELAWGDGHLVHVWANNSDRLDEAWQIADQSRLLGTRVIIEQGSQDRLPYADHTVDLLITPQTDLTSQRIDEMLRVVRPNGKILLRTGLTLTELESWVTQHVASPAVVQSTPFGAWATITKGRPAGEGDWSHIEHGPDNNPVADDTLIRAPYMTKWLGQPYYIAMPAITVAAQGRIFLATGHIAHHEREEPWLNVLMARNGYNGTVLWKRQLPDGYLVHRSAFVASGQTFYMIDTDGSGCLMLDAETGEEQGRLDLPTRRGQWKWMAIRNGVLLAMVGDEKDPPQTTVIRSDRAHWSWGELSDGYYPKRIPWGFGSRICAFDVETGKLLWQHSEVTPIDSRGMVIGDDQVYFYCPDAALGSLHLRTGEVRWRNEDQAIRDLIEQAGKGLSSTPGFRTMNFCLYTPQVLIFQGQTRQNVVAVSTQNGELLWNRQKTTNNPNPLSLDGQLIIGIGESGESLVVDPRSGTTLRQLGFAKRSCARLTATSDSLFCRGMPEGLTRFDLNSQQVQFNGAVRPSCNDGVVAANGLLYMGPWACDCNLTLMGRVVMCSAGEFDFRRADVDTALRQASDLSLRSPLATDGADWPTYRGDFARGASSPVDVESDVTVLWTYHPDRPSGTTQVATSGRLLFLARDDGAVQAIDAVAGTPVWTYHTAGPILQPPTIAEGRAYVGSGDGHVYCLDANSGRLLWQFRAAPIERRIPVYGSLSSTWPVHSGVVVRDGVAYAAAGIIDYDGTYIYALDAENGELIWHNDQTGHLDPTLRKGVSCQGGLAIADGRLWMPAGNIVSPAAYDLKSGEYRGPMPDDGSPRTNRGEEIGIFRGQHVVLGGRLRFSAAKNVVNPGYFGIHPIGEGGVGGGKQVQQGKIPPAWNEDYFVAMPGNSGIPAWFRAADLEATLREDGGVEGARRRGTLTPVAAARGLEDVNTVAVALAKNAVVSVYRQATPGHRDGRWIMRAFDLRDGETMWQRKLPGPARPGALSIDRDGRVLVVLEDGRVICAGGKSLLQPLLTTWVRDARENPDRRDAIVSQLHDTLSISHAADVTLSVADALLQLGVDVRAESRDHGSISRWRVVAPVPWNASYPTDTRWVGEPSVDTESSVTVNDQSLTWDRVVTLDPHGKVDLASSYGTLPNVAAYAVSDFELPAAQPMAIGSVRTTGLFAGSTDKRLRGKRRDAVMYRTTT